MANVAGCIRLPLTDAVYCVTRWPFYTLPNQGLLRIAVSLSGLKPGNYHIEIIKWH
jgi:hypothetical protein